MYYLEMFGISLILTILVEGILGYLLGMRSVKQQKLMALVNILTNPAAVLLCWLGISELIVEIGVIAAECLIYYWFSKDEQWRLSHPVLLGVVLNVLSWTAGMMLGGLL